MGFTGLMRFVELKEVYRASVYRADRVDRV